MVESLRRQKNAVLKELTGLQSLRPSHIRRVSGPLALLESRYTSSYNVLSHPALSNVASCGKRFHFSYRAIVITQEALSLTLPFVSPAPVEVFLRRHDSKAPPAPRGTFTHIGVCLWPEWHGNNALVSFHIAPRSVKVLATLGVTPSPLQIQRAEEEILLTTTLRIAPASNTENRRLEDGFVQTIQVQLFLSRIDRTLKDTRVRFAITNTVHTPSRDPPYPSSPHASALRRSLYENAALPVRSEYSSTAEVNSSRNSTDTITSANFMVPSSLSSDSDICETRLLRVALELPVEGNILRHRKDLWLPIELSEPHRHTRTNNGSFDNRVLSTYDPSNGNMPSTSNDSSQAHVETGATSPFSRFESPVSVSAVNRIVCVRFDHALTWDSCRRHSYTRNIQFSRHPCRPPLHILTFNQRHQRLHPHQRPGTCSRGQGVFVQSPWDTET